MPPDRRPWIAPVLARRGFTAAVLLDLPGEVVGGHADRHVVRVALRRRVAYLKREHRVRWTDRLANALAGFGWVPHSVREATVLKQLRAAGLPVPRVLACGEHDGRAFLLVQAMRGYVDLRTYLHAGGRRRGLARRLGELLARVHASGFAMPDLLCKHVLVHRRTQQLALIDWARSRQQARVGRTERVRDFALLHASLADGLATTRDRLTCLRAYACAACGLALAPSIKPWAAAIRQAAQRLQHRRSARELRQPPRPSSGERLRWQLGDESLCVTRTFWKRGRDMVPGWLHAAAQDPAGQPRIAALRWHGFRVLLQTFPAAGRVRRIFARLRGRRVTSPAVRTAGLILRLRRYGVPTPQLLAFGQRPDGSGVLLTRPAPAAVPLADWLTTPHLLRPRLLSRVGVLLRRLHAAGGVLGERAAALHVSGEGATLVLADVLSVALVKRLTDAGRARDLRQFATALGLRPGDAGRVARGYFGRRAGQSVKAVRP